MYAVIQTGNKQYRVTQNQIISIEKIEGKPGEAVHFNTVLMVVSQNGSIQVGSPCINDATVKGELIEQGRKKKVEILKFKRRKHHMKRQGHRQDYTKVRITDIQC